jgi:prepilin-type N-terminal cleavage/methylation domain-containing protein
MNRLRYGMDRLLARWSRGVQRRAATEGGFTIIELVVSMALLSIVAAPLASVFWSAIRTAGAAAHRTDGSSIASREIEGMRAVPYAQVGFYDDQGAGSAFEGHQTVSLGTTSPATGALIPQMQPNTPDPNAAAGYAPDPDPTNASPIVQGGVVYTVARYVVWESAQDTSTTYTKAYKRLTVIVTWTDRAGAHVVRQDSLLYPGGLGKYIGPAGGSTTTTTTAPPVNPTTPLLGAITPLASPSDQTQVALAWSQPAGGGAVTSYSIEYSTNASFPAGNFTVIAGLAPSITNFTVTSLTPNTTYFFEIVAYAGANSAVSSSQSITTAPLPGPICTLGGLNVAGATSLSTTGTILKKSGRMSENLTVSWTTTGPCTDSYEVRAFDTVGNADPSSPYALSGSAGSYSSVVASNGTKGWAVGLHTFRVWDISTSSATSVVKTFKVCVFGSVSC